MIPRRAVGTAHVSLLLAYRGLFYRDFRFFSGLETTLSAQEVAPPLLDRYRQRGVINPERPASPSFYTGKHSLNDIVLELEEKLQLLRKNPQALAKPEHQQSSILRQLEKRRGLKPVDWNRFERSPDWLSKTQVSQLVAAGQTNVKITTSDYNRVMHLLDQIRREPNKDVLTEYLKDFHRLRKIHRSKLVQNHHDSLNRIYAAAKRKSASAQVWLIEGDGKLVVNGSDFLACESEAELGGRDIRHTKAVIAPLIASGLFGKVNVWCRVHGGGQTGTGFLLWFAISSTMLKLL